MLHRRNQKYLLLRHKRARLRTAGRGRRVRGVAAAFVAMVVVVVLGLLATVASAALLYYQSQAAQIRALPHTVAAQDSLRIYDDAGTLLYQTDNAGAQHSISLANVPLTVVNATVAIEDHDFWVNQGVDFTAVVRAVQADLHAGKTAQGASTITQQLIKQQILGNSPTIDRKVREVILALGMTLTQTYSKGQILEMYLNTIPYSPLAYGIDSAAHDYFGYSDDPPTGMTAAQHLDLAQASMLAGIPQNPNLNDPLLHPAQAATRQQQVLAAMVRYGYITRAQAAQATAEAKAPGFFHPPSGVVNLAPHFVEYIQNTLAQLEGSVIPTQLSRSGLNVYTTLDLATQNNVQQNMQNHLYGNDRDDYGGGLIRNDHLTNAAALLVDHHTGAIKVLLGSVDYNNATIDGNFDVATDGYRGPGSAFKPIAYAAAFMKGWFPAATIPDMPTEFYDVGAGKIYRPTDFTQDEFRGELTLRHALQDSLNIPAVRVMQFAGVDNVERLAQSMGVTHWAQGARWGLSSVLGSLDVTPMEMVQAYTVFANYGQYIPLHAIDHITSASGDVLYQYTPPPPRQVLDPRIAFLITSVLSDNPMRADDFGGCSPLYLDPNPADCQAYHFNSPNAWPAAAKTGTGMDFSDDWTLGYTMDYTMGVWAGNSDHSPMYHIDGITGSAPIWYHSMLQVERGLPKQQFPVPAGVQRAPYCSNGICTTDWFLAGKLPPPNVGEAGPASLPCIALTNGVGWVPSSPPNCQGHVRPATYN